MNTLTARIGVAVLVYTVVLLSGCRHMENRVSVSHAVPVCCIDFAVTTSLYKKENSLRLKLAVTTSEGVINRDLEIHRGMQIFLEGYANAIIVVENVNADSASIRDVMGYTNTYHIGDGWDSEFLNVDMLEHYR